MSEDKELTWMTKRLHGHCKAATLQNLTEVCFYLFLEKKFSISFFLYWPNCTSQLAES